MFLRPWDDTSTPLLLGAGGYSVELGSEAADVSLLSLAVQSPRPLCALCTGKGPMIWRFIGVTSSPRCGEL